MAPKELWELMVEGHMSLNEAKTPSEQAHDLGLTHVGYGYWADDSGDIVARTYQGHLIQWGSKNTDDPELAKQSIASKKANDKFDDESLAIAVNGENAVSALSDHAIDIVPKLNKSALMPELSKVITLTALSKKVPDNDHLANLVINGGLDEDERDDLKTFLNYVATHTTKMTKAIAMHAKAELAAKKASEAEMGPSTDDEALATFKKSQEGKPQVAWTTTQTDATTEPVEFELPETPRHDNAEEITDKAKNGVIDIDYALQLMDLNVSLKDNPKFMQLVGELESKDNTVALNYISQKMKKAGFVDNQQWKKLWKYLKSIKDIKAGPVEPGKIKQKKLGAQPTDTQSTASPEVSNAPASSEVGTLTPYEMLPTEWDEETKDNVATVISQLMSDAWEDTGTDLNLPSDQMLKFAEHVKGAMTAPTWAEAYDQVLDAEGIIHNSYIFSAVSKVRKAKGLSTTTADDSEPFNILAMTAAQQKMYDKVMDTLYYTTKDSVPTYQMAAFLHDNGATKIIADIINNTGKYNYSDLYDKLIGNGADSNVAQDIIELIQHEKHLAGTPEPTADKTDAVLNADLGTLDVKHAVEDIAHLMGFGYSTLATYVNPQCEATMQKFWNGHAATNDMMDALTNAGISHGNAVKFTQNLVDLKANAYEVQKSTPNAPAPTPTSIPQDKVASVVDAAYQAVYPGTTTTFDKMPGDFSVPFTDAVKAVANGNMDGATEHLVQAGYDIEVAKELVQHMAGTLGTGDAQSTPVTKSNDEVLAAVFQTEFPGVSPMALGDKTKKGVFGAIDLAKKGMDYQSLSAYLQHDVGYEENIAKQMAAGILAQVAPSATSATSADTIAHTAFKKVFPGNESTLTNSPALPAFHQAVTMAQHGASASKIADLISDQGYDPETATALAKAVIATVQQSGQSTPSAAAVPLTTTEPTMLDMQTAIIKGLAVSGILNPDDFTKPEMDELTKFAAQYVNGELDHVGAGKAFSKWMPTKYANDIIKQLKPLKQPAPQAAASQGGLTNIMPDDLMSHINDTLFDYTNGDISLNADFSQNEKNVTIANSQDYLNGFINADQFVKKMGSVLSHAQANAVVSALDGLKSPPQAAPTTPKAVHFDEVKVSSGISKFLGSQGIDWDVDYNNKEKEQIMDGAEAFLSGKMDEKTALKYLSNTLYGYSEQKAVMDALKDYQKTASDATSTPSPSSNPVPYSPGQVNDHLEDALNAVNIAWPEDYSPEGADEIMNGIQTYLLGTMDDTAFDEFLTDTCNEQEKAAILNAVNAYKQDVGSQDTTAAAQDVNPLATYDVPAPATKAVTTALNSPWSKGDPQKVMKWVKNKFVAADAKSKGNFVNMALDLVKNHGVPLTDVPALMIPPAIKTKIDAAQQQAIQQAKAKASAAIQANAPQPKTINPTTGLPSIFDTDEDKAAAQAQPQVGFAGLNAAINTPTPAAAPVDNSTFEDINPAGLVSSTLTNSGIQPGQLPAGVEQGLVDAVTTALDSPTEFGIVHPFLKFKGKVSDEILDAIKFTIISKKTAQGMLDTTPGSFKKYFDYDEMLSNMANGNFSEKGGMNASTPEQIDKFKKFLASVTPEDRKKLSDAMQKGLSFEGPNGGKEAIAFYKDNLVDKIPGFDDDVFQVWRRALRGYHDELKDAEEYEKTKKSEALKKQQQQIADAKAAAELQAALDALGSGDGAQTIKALSGAVGLDKLPPASQKKVLDSLALALQQPDTQEAFNQLYKITGQGDGHIDGGHGYYGSSSKSGAVMTPSDPKFQTLKKLVAQAILDKQDTYNPSSEPATHEPASTRATRVFDKWLEMDGLGKGTVPDGNQERQNLINAVEAAIAEKNPQNVNSIINSQVATGTSLGDHQIASLRKMVQQERMKPGSLAGEPLKQYFQKKIDPTTGPKAYDPMNKPVAIPTTTPVQPGIPALTSLKNEKEWKEKSAYYKLAPHEKDVVHDIVLDALKSPVSTWNKAGDKATIAKNALQKLQAAGIPFDQARKIALWASREAAEGSPLATKAKGTMATQAASAASSASSTTAPSHVPVPSNQQQYRAQIAALPDTGTNKLAKTEFVEGEYVKISHGTIDWNSKGDGDPGCVTEAKKQDQWRKKTLAPADFKRFETAANSWQAGGQWGKSIEERKAINHIMTKTIEGPPPQYTKIDKFVERGMPLTPDNFREFIKGVKVGEKMYMGPSGFSASNKTAKQFGGADYSHGGNISVIMRVRPPANGMVKGARVHDRDSHMHQGEKELVLGTNNNTRVLAVTKHVVMDNYSGAERVAYEIELQYEEDLNESVGNAVGLQTQYWKGLPRETVKMFIKYLNTPLRAIPNMPQSK